MIRVKASGCASWIYVAQLCCNPLNINQVAIIDCFMKITNNWVWVATKPDAEDDPNQLNKQ